MDAIQSFYYNERQVLTDEDFDKLKEDLAWEGSQVCSPLLPLPLPPFPESFLFFRHSLFWKHGPGCPALFIQVVSLFPPFSLIAVCLFLSLS